MTETTTTESYAPAMTMPAPPHNNPYINQASAALDPSANLAGVGPGIAAQYGLPYNPPSQSNVSSVGPSNAGPYPNPYPASPSSVSQHPSSLIPGNYQNMQGSANGNVSSEGPVPSGIVQQRVVQFDKPRLAPLSSQSQSPTVGQLQSQLFQQQQMQIQQAAAHSSTPIHAMMTQSHSQQPQVNQVSMGGGMPQNHSQQPQVNQVGMGGGNYGLPPRPGPRPALQAQSSAPVSTGHYRNHPSQQPVMHPPSRSGSLNSAGFNPPMMHQEVQQQVYELKFYNREDPFYEFTNFSPDKVAYRGREYPTSEHAFQAQKFLAHRPALAEHIRTFSDRPRDAFEEARRFQPEWRPDWHSVKIQMMDEILHAKFTQNPRLRQMLVNTGNAILIEDSPYDPFWGVGRDGTGENQLGQSLMRLRTALQQEDAAQQAHMHAEVMQAEVQSMMGQPMMPMQ